jgi:hypothetical protein
MPREPVLPWYAPSTGFCLCQLMNAPIRLLQAFVEFPPSRFTLPLHTLPYIADQLLLWVQYYVTWRSSVPEYMRLFAGYDTLSNPRLASIAMTARDTGDIAVTYPFQSVLGSTSAVAMYYPVYKQLLGANATVEYLRATLTGAETILLL